MLFNTVKNRNYTVDCTGYILVTSADGTVTQKEYDVVPINHPVQIATSFVGDLIVLADVKLQVSTLLSNLLDRNGAEVYDNAVWEITQSQPVVNAVGLVEGYKYKAKIITGNV